MLHCFIHLWCRLNSLSQIFIICGRYWGLAKRKGISGECAKKTLFLLDTHIHPTQLLPRRVEVHCLQCKNCQYSFLGQYPSKMNDFFYWPPFTKWDDYHPTPARPDPFNWSKTHSTGPQIMNLKTSCIFGNWINSRNVLTAVREVECQLTDWNNILFKKKNNLFETVEKFSIRFSVFHCSSFWLSWRLVC